jgi:formamidopyrimidine-DNA glycosylase
MPELPEVEITARLLDGALGGAEVESASAPGINALKTFAPPLSALAGRTIAGVRRRGKNIVVEVAPAGDLAEIPAHETPAHETPAPGERSPEARSPERLVLLIHLMSAGRLQLFETRAGPRDRTSRLLVRLRDGRELRLREFGSKQAAWVKLLRASELEADEALAKLGPEAWPDPGSPERLRELLRAPRPLHNVLRDQRTIAGIGRSWADEILWRAKLSPYKRGSELSGEEAGRLREAIVETFADAIAHYEHTIQLPIPDKLPMPLQVHRHEGEPCPRCGDVLRAVHFEDYTVAYCSACQTGGRVLKDRRLSRLLK